MAGFSINTQSFPTWHEPGRGLTAPGISGTPEASFHQIFLGDLNPDFALSNELRFAYPEHYAFSASRFTPRTTEEFGEVLTIVATACRVIALSPAHSHPTGLYLHRDSKLGDGRYYISTTALEELIGAVTLNGATIILDGCDNQRLGPVFMCLGARSVYTHTVAGYGIDWNAVLDHLIQGIPLPSGSDMELFH